MIRIHFANKSMARKRTAPVAKRTNSVGMKLSAKRMKPNNKKMDAAENKMTFNTNAKTRFLSMLTAVSASFLTSEVRPFSMPSMMCCNMVILAPFALDEHLKPDTTDDTDTKRHQGSLKRMFAHLLLSGLLDVTDALSVACDRLLDAFDGLCES